MRSWTRRCGRNEWAAGARSRRRRRCCGRADRLLGLAVGWWAWGCSGTGPRRARTDALCSIHPVPCGCPTRARRRRITARSRDVSTLFVNDSGVAQTRHNDDAADSRSPPCAPMQLRGTLPDPWPRATSPRDQAISWARPVGTHRASPPPIPGSAGEERCSGSPPRTARRSDAGRRHLGARASAPTFGDAVSGRPRRT